MEIRKHIGKENRIDQKHYNRVRGKIEGDQTKIKAESTEKKHVK